MAICICSVVNLAKLVAPRIRVWVVETVAKLFIMSIIDSTVKLGEPEKSFIETEMFLGALKFLRLVQLYTTLVKLVTLEASKLLKSIDSSAKFSRKTSLSALQFYISEFLIKFT